MYSLDQQLIFQLGFCIVTFKIVNFLLGFFIILLHLWNFRDYFFILMIFYFLVLFTQILKLLSIVRVKLGQALPSWSQEVLGVVASIWKTKRIWLLQLHGSLGLLEALLIRLGLQLLQIYKSTLLWSLAFRLEIAFDAFIYQSLHFVASFLRLFAFFWLFLKILFAKFCLFVKISSE